MTYLRAPSRATQYDVPSFPTSAVLRDRTEEAREHAARMRDAGYQEGLRAGRADGADEIARSVAETRAANSRLATAAGALQSAALDFQRRDAVSIADLEAQSVALAVQLAEAIVGRELASCDAPVLDAMRRASGLLPDRGTPTLSVHPDDEQTAREAVAADPSTWTAGVSVVADASVETGGCLVEVGPCRIDAQISTALERMRSTLMPSSSDGM